MRLKASTMHLISTNQMTFVPDNLIFIKRSFLLFKREIFLEKKKQKVASAPTLAIIYTGHC